MSSRPGDDGERGGRDAVNGRPDGSWYWERPFMWRMYVMVALMIAAVLAGLAWGLWWLFIGAYN